MKKLIFIAILAFMGFTVKGQATDSTIRLDSVTRLAFNPLQSIKVDTMMDANTDTVTTALDVKGARNFSLTVDTVTGAHTTHVVTLQTSFDGWTWNSTSTTVTGKGTANLSNLATRFVRAKVTTAESAASVIHIIIIAN